MGDNGLYFVVGELLLRHADGILLVLLGSAFTALDDGVGDFGVSGALYPGVGLESRGHSGALAVSSVARRALRLVDGHAVSGHGGTSESSDAKSKNSNSQ